MSGNRGEESKVSRIAREDEGDVSSRWKGVFDLKSHDDTSARIDDDDTNELLQRLRNPKSSNESQKKSDNDKMILTIPDSYEITPNEKAAIKDYLDKCKTNVNFLKKRLIDLLLELVINNVDTQKILAINDRSNAYSAYNTFNTTDLYNYDLNDFVHYVDERYNDYKEINEIVYKLKFINIIYLILQNNASLGVSPREYKEPVFKYKDLITQDILNGEKGLNVSSFKIAYTEFREKFPFDKKEQSLPVAKGVVSNFQIDHIKSKLQEFITVYNLYQVDANYKLKNPENGDDIENLKYLQSASPPILFQNDTRWDNLKMHELVDSNPDKNYIKGSFKDKLISIDKTISLIKEAFKKDNPNYAKYTKQLLNQISFAEQAINQTATETSNPTTPSADILTELNKFIKDYNNAIKDKSLSLQEQGTKLSNLQFAKPGFRNLFNNDTRWDSWKPPKDTTPPEPFIQLNMRNILVRINNAISIYNKTTDDDLKTYLKIYLLEQIAVAQSFISKKLDKDDLLKEVNYKLTNFILTYNELIPKNYILKDINTSSEIKELKYEFGADDIKFEKKNWDGWDDTLKKEKGIKKNSMKDPLININTAIKALQKAIIKNNNDETITKIDILEKKIDDAIDFIGLDIYIPGDAKRIKEAEQKFTIGETVKLTGMTVNTELNGKEVKVINYSKIDDRWSVSYDDDNTGNKKETSLRPSKMLKISPTPAIGGNSPTKYKSTGITVSIMYEKKKYKRAVYTKDNTKTKYCKIDGEYILLSKIKNLSNKNPQRTSPKSRGGLGEDGDLNTKIKTYLDDSVGTVKFLKHRLVYKLLEYMNSTNEQSKFDKDSTNVFEVYESFKVQGTNGLYVYDLKSFQLYNDKEDEKYKEINNIVYKLKLINIVYLILKNNSSRGDIQNKYKGFNFKYELKSLFKDEGTERALDQKNFKVAYQIWVSNNDPIENIPKATGQTLRQAKPVETRSLVQKTPDEVKSAYNKVINKLKEFIITYNKVEPKENYKLEEPGKIQPNLENLEFSESNAALFKKKSTFSKDTRWNKWTASQNKDIRYISVNIGEDLKNIDGAITEARNAYTTFENNVENNKDNKTGIEKALATIEELNKTIDTTIKDKIGIKLYNMWKPKAGGNPPTKYKSTGITVYILYEKKKYKRTVYTKDNRKTKYCKINNKYILLSKLNVVE